MAVKKVWSEVCKVAGRDTPLEALNRIYFLLAKKKRDVCIHCWNGHECLRVENGVTFPVC